MRETRGTSLTEVMITLTLLGSFMLIAFRFMEANFELSRATLAADTFAASYDRAVATLRRDVEVATSLSQTADGSIRLKSDQEIEWKSAGNLFSRKTGASSQQWEMGQPMTLTIDHGILLLDVSPGDQVAMAPRLARGKR